MPDRGRGNGDGSPPQLGERGKGARPPLPPLFAGSCVHPARCVRAVARAHCCFPPCALCGCARVPRRSPGVGAGAGLVLCVALCARPAPGLRADGRPPLPGGCGGSPGGAGIAACVRVRCARLGVGGNAPPERG